MWGIGIYEADDQHGCSKHGVSVLTALYREVEVRGKCASKCSLGSSIRELKPPVNNHGIADKSLDEEVEDSVEDKD